MANPGSEELHAELSALRRQNEQLSQLVEQAIRIGERLLMPAREAVRAYEEYVRMAAVSPEAAEPSSSRLALVMDELCRLVSESKPTPGDSK